MQIHVREPIPDSIRAELDALLARVHLIGMAVRGSDFQGTARDSVLTAVGDCEVAFVNLLDDSIAEGAR
jgi:hypothetical protein